LQFLLSELRINYDALPDVKQSGRFDTETSDAVRMFQRIQGIGQTGLVDRNTWNRIAKEYALLSQNLL
jgi:peptidoglycan hydrolase-like protein with peptidoglycan-binding domain